MLRNRRAFILVMANRKDTTAPTLTIAALSAVGNVVAIRITASEEVTGFAVGDITISGGSLANFATADNTVFTVSWTIADGANTMDIAANVCTDTAGNNNIAATQFGITSLTIASSAASTADCYVREDSADGTTPATTNYVMVATAGSRRFGLVKFDLSSIVDQTVYSSTLTLYNQNTQTGNRVLTLNSILAANSGWVEGASWNYANPSTVRWAGDAGGDGGTDAGCSVSGTDWNATQLGQFTYAANTPADTAHTCELVASQVQAWLTANYGFIMRVDTSTIAFHSSDAATAGLRPAIRVVYSSNP